LLLLLVVLMLVLLLLLVMLLLVYRAHALCVLLFVDTAVLSADQIRREIDDSKSKRVRERGLVSDIGYLCCSYKI
jgi:competence protein ComGF